MNDFVKETLEKQMKLLSKRSEKAVGGELNSYTEQIINLAKILDPELRNQSCAEVLSRLPAATLTMSDLEEIAAARKAKLRREDEAFRQLLNDHGIAANTPSGTFEIKQKAEVFRNE